MFSLDFVFCSDLNHMREIIMRLASMMVELKKELFEVPFRCVFFESRLLSVCYKLNVCVCSPLPSPTNSYGKS